jgi:hypothetical protein
MTIAGTVRILAKTATGLPEKLGGGGWMRYRTEWLWCIDDNGRQVVRRRGLSRWWNGNESPWFHGLQRLFARREQCPLIILSPWVALAFV